LFDCYRDVTDLSGTDYGESIKNILTTCDVFVEYLDDEVADKIKLATECVPQNYRDIYVDDDIIEGDDVYDVCMEVYSRVLKVFTEHLNTCSFFEKFQALFDVLMTLGSDGITEVDSKITSSNDAEYYMGNAFAHIVRQCNNEEISRMFKIILGEEDEWRSYKGADHRGCFSSDIQQRLTKQNMIRGYLIAFILHLRGDILDLPDFWERAPTYGLLDRSIENSEVDQSNISVHELKMIAEIKHHCNNKLTDLEE
jgi:hypothetical protein